MIGVPRALVVRVSPAGALSGQDVDQIWGLMSRSVKRARPEFEARLASCDQVYLLHERASGDLAGFMALHEVRDPVGTLLHAQWVFMAPRWRGGLGFQMIGARLFLRALARGKPVWLLFSAATINSFMMIAGVVPKLWLASQSDLPSDLRGLIDRGMQRVAGDAWDPAAGVIRGRGRWSYAEGVVAPGTADLSPLVRRFVEANPGQADGDALVCLVPLTMKNWLVGITRLVRRARRRAVAR